VSWQNQGKLVEVICKNIISAQLYDEQDVILVVSATTNTIRGCKDLRWMVHCCLRKNPLKGIPLCTYQHRETIHLLFVMEGKIMLMHTVEVLGVSLSIQKQVI
jgi:hypothetical protein